MTMSLVQTVTVGAGGAANIEFTTIPQDATDLLLVISVRGTNASNTVVPQVKFNGSSANYSGRYLLGDGSAATSGTTSGYVYIGASAGANLTASTFDNKAVYIPNYAGSTAKSVSADGVFENNATLGGQAITANLWNDTSAITSIAIAPSTGNWAQHSTASLYKITKA